MKRKLIQKFKEVFGPYGEIKAYFAPGRVNLIGEHTDYNGGHVFPCALTLGIYGIARKRKDRKLRFYSVNFEKLGIVRSNLDDLIPCKKAGWTNYPKGVMRTFEERGYSIPVGLDFLIFGNIPNGSGLSSSAALEVLTGLILRDMFGFTISMKEIAKIGQYSENHFNGCNCGVMDQFASALGRRNHAIFLNTNTLRYEYTPVMLKEEKIVLVNSKVKHSLVDSAYNDRRQECEMALQELQKVVDVKKLGDLTEEMFEIHKGAILSEIRQKRARHAVCENQRTIKAVAALKKNDIAQFGRLMNESHKSLRDDYEVSCEEIDALVEMAWQMEGVMGSRITGGGFGGCTVNIVKNDVVQTFIETIGAKYKEKFGREAEFYVVHIGRGAHTF